MRIVIATWLAISLAALLACPANARDDVQVRGRVDIGLGDFDIVIGDMGEKSPSWNGSATRVHIAVLDGRRTNDHYFDSLPAALFVLREMYGTPRIVQLDVPEYGGRGMIDGVNAYYLWDYDDYSRGGLPLVLAFSNYSDALEESQYRNGEVLDFNDLVPAMYRWSDNDRDRIYWRGWDKDRWDATRWNNAWNSRWSGWGWDNHNGWLKLNINLGGGDRDRGRHDRGGYDRNRGERPDGHGRDDSDRHHNDRDRNRDNHEQYDRDRGDRAHGNGDGNGRNRDDHNNGDRARGDGHERDGGNGDQANGNGNGHGDRGKGNGKGHGKDKGEQGKEPVNRQSGRVRDDGGQGGKADKTKSEPSPGGTNRQTDNK